LNNYVIEALVTVDKRGQIVIPKEVRRITNLHNGDKLVVITHAKEGESCYIFLAKTKTILNEYMSTYKGDTVKWI
jgi:antitoxin PrlF